MQPPLRSRKKSLSDVGVFRLCVYRRGRLCEKSTAPAKPATMARTPILMFMKHLSNAPDVSALRELLTTVNVVGCAGKGRVGHQVDGQSGDVLRADHAADRERRAELLAPRIQLIAEQGC